MKQSEFIANPLVFKKTEKEKELAKHAKKDWKRTMKMFYGESEWKKHNNYPFTLKDH